MFNCIFFKQCDIIFEPQFNFIITFIYNKLQKPTEDVKKDLAKKLRNFRSSGFNDDQLDPFKNALEAAFKLQPDVIYFLCDGNFDKRLVDIVTNDLNKDKKVRINTLMWVSTDPDCEKQLKEIAKKNGGVYKFVSEKDLK